MTINQIAEATGRDSRSVQRWAKSLGDKVSSINDKVSSSNSTYPADYTLEEVCQIIEEGLGKAAADVYRNNAVYTEMQKNKKQVIKETLPKDKLPSGAQLNSMRLGMNKQDFTKAVFLMIGYKEPERIVVQTEPIATPEQGQLALESLKSRFQG